MSESIVYLKSFSEKLKTKNAQTVADGIEEIKKYTDESCSVDIMKLIYVYVVLRLSDVFGYDFQKKFFFCIPSDFSEANEKFDELIKYTREHFKRF